MKRVESAFHRRAMPETDPNEQRDHGRASSRHPARPGNASLGKPGNQASAGALSRRVLPAGDGPRYALLLAEDPCSETRLSARKPAIGERWVWKVGPLLFGLAICAVPLSIALAESLLAFSLLFQVTATARRRAKLHLPRVFWFWLLWAVLELGAWLRASRDRAGLGEMRHLLLIAALFVMVPALQRASDRVLVWRGVALTASISSLFLIGNFMWRIRHHERAGDPMVYLRSGGLLHHWMVYGTVEILVFAGLLELWQSYPEEHGWLFLVLAINGIAIVLSLTRMLWISCLLLLAVHLAWQRSRRLWTIPILAFAVFFLGPSAVRERAAESVHADSYSNAERLQMLRVGWEMIRQNPLSGVGPGRVEELYTKYLSASDRVPSYHGHLHNNLVQLAAEYGVPVAVAAVLFVVVLFGELRKRCRLALDRDQEFLCRTALLALIGFVVAGLFEYTYGHALGLILLAFAVLSPLIPPDMPDDRETISR